MLSRKQKYLNDADTSGLFLNRKRAKPSIVKDFERHLYFKLSAEGNSTFECVASFAEQLKVDFASQLSFHLVQKLDPCNDERIQKQQFSRNWYARFKAEYGLN